jgi:hypothetical protein
MRVFAAALLALGLAAGSAGAGETLLMLERDGCLWCARWRAEVGDAYPKTAEGRRAPLRTVDLGEPWPEDLAGVRPEALTPTFILLRDGVEVGRLRGYAGEDFFWPMLADLLARP